MGVGLILPLFWRKEMSKHKTIGEHAMDLDFKKPDTLNFQEQTAQDLSEWDKMIENCLDVGLKGLPNQDFYIVILNKHEVIFGGRPVFHLLPFVQPVCPSPEYDQTVLKYHKDSGTMEHIWTLPDQETYNWYVDNSTQVSPDRWALLNFVLRDKQGDLLRQAKILNGESWLDEVRPETVDMSY